MAGRVVYSIAIQMPNVTSFSGSWLVWFAEREPVPGAAPRQMRPPVVVRKVDPKYVAAAAAERVEGTVRLFGVIRKDGHVGGDRAAAATGRAPGPQRAGSAGEVGVRAGAAQRRCRWTWTRVFEIPFHLAPATTTMMTRQHLIIDADDTLWENNIYFERAFEEFVEFLDHSSLTPQEVRDMLDEIERANAADPRLRLAELRPQPGGSATSTWWSGRSARTICGP